MRSMEEKPLPLCCLCLPTCFFYLPLIQSTMRVFFFFLFVFHYYDIVFTFSLIKPITSKMVDTWLKLAKAQAEIDNTLSKIRKNDC